MKVLICENRLQALHVAAGLVCDQVAAKPNSVLGFATGGTMEALYPELVALQRTRGLTWQGVRSFNLDEYVGLPSSHTQSYHYFMQQHVFGPLGMNPANSHLPRGDAVDLDQECQAYEQAIAEAGGIDLQLLGIGENGHIGFNEPSSSLRSRTRIKQLTANTIAANQRFFSPSEFQPRMALTMGVATISDAGHILLLALGPSKAAAVASMVEGPVSAMCPASALQLHPAVTVVLDPEAAQSLVLQDYYRSIHPSQTLSAQGR
jgi:glucosamine-6-phosphate deaminase